MKKFVLLAVAGIFLGSVVLGNETPSKEASLSEKGITATTLPQENLFVAIEKRGIIVPKDPLIAGLLSVQCPGLGQIYCRRYLRGITYFASEIGCFILSAKLAGVETCQYAWMAENEDTGEKRKLTQEISISKWDDLSGFERAGVVGLIFGGIGLHIWNVIDAYHLAKEHNIRLGWVENIDVQLGFKDNAPSIKLAVSKNF